MAVVEPRRTYLIKRVLGVALMSAVLAVLAGGLWREVAPRRAVVPQTQPAAVVTRSLPGGLKLVVPDGTVLESAGYPLAGRFVSSDAAKRTRVQAAWSEASSPLTTHDVEQVQVAWLGALAASHLAPPMQRVAPYAGGSALHTCSIARGEASSDEPGARKLEYRAYTWVCPQTHRLIHVLLSAPQSNAVTELESALLAKSSCHDEGAAAAVGPRAHLPAAAGWREISVTGARRSYTAPNGLVDVIVEEGPRPATSPVDHVMKNSDLWPALLAGVVGRPLPVAVPGAVRVTTLAHGHEAVRVHGRVQPPASATSPLAPILYVETTIWVCPQSDRMVSVSAVTPDRKALERARAVLDGAQCH